MAGGGLRRLAAAVLGVTLDKALAVRCSEYGCSLITYGCSLHYMRLQVRCSDWEAVTLSAEQVITSSCRLITYGCRRCCTWLQARSHPAAGSVAYGCRLYRIRLQVRYAAEDARVGFELLLALHARCLPPLPLDAWVQRQLATAPPRRPTKPAPPPPPPGRNSASGAGGGAPGGGGGGGGAAPSDLKKRLPGPSRATPLYDGLGLGLGGASDGVAPPEPKRRLSGSYYGYTHCSHRG